MTTSDERRAAGREVQGQLWPAILKGPTGQFPAAKLAPDFFDYVQQSVFGDIWTRPGLPVRDRSMITVAVLAALGQTEELRSHVAGALSVGISARRSWRSSCTSPFTPASPRRARPCARRPTCSARTENTESRPWARRLRPACRTYSGAQRRATPARPSATVTSSLQSAPPNPSATAASSTSRTATATGVGAPSSLLQSTMSPASLAASAKANCVGRPRPSIVSTWRSMKKFDAPAVRRTSTAVWTSIPAFVDLASPSRLTRWW